MGWIGDGMEGMERMERMDGMDGMDGMEGMEGMGGGRKPLDTFILVIAFGRKGVWA